MVETNLKVNKIMLGNEANLIDEEEQKNSDEH